ncbi:MAG: hypothetical protein E6J89_17800, partial [Deltaproteobacteria bacterium]
MPSAPPHRLPDAVIPERYEIRLTPDLTASTFAGEEIVFLNVQEPVREVVLNACELTIHSASAISAAGVTTEGKSALDEANERAVLSFSPALGPGTWKLRLVFSGIL